MTNKTVWKDNEIGGLWKKPGNGKKKPFLCGPAEIGGVKGRLFVFPNEKKENQNAPDCRAYFLIDDGNSPKQAKTYPKKNYRKPEEAPRNENEQQGGEVDQEVVF